MAQRQIDFRLLSLRLFFYFYFSQLSKLPVFRIGAFCAEIYTRLVPVGYWTKLTLLAAVRLVVV